MNEQSKEYKRFANHLHNTLGLTKEDIREMVQKSVDKVVERKMDVMFGDKWSVQHLVDEAIKENLTMHNYYWGDEELKLDKYVKEEVVRRLIKGISLDVTIKKPRKKKTSE